MKEKIKTLLQQINSRELKFAKFQLGYTDKDTSITIRKGKRCIEIKYNYGTDLYDLRLWKNLSMKTIDEYEKMEGIYEDMLRKIITDHFPNFEYIMDSII